MKLDVKQQSLVMQGGKLGMDIFDSLIHAGCTSDQAEELQRDAEVRDAFHKGRAEGSRMVREVLMKSAQRGNVSAVKVLRLHEAAVEDLKDSKAQDTRSDAERRAEWKRINDHVAWTFERMKLLHDGVNIIGTAYERDPF